MRRLCFYRCLSVILFTGRGWYPSMHCRWYPSMPCSRSPEGGWGWYSSMPCRFPGPHPGGGKMRGIWPGGSQGPHQGGKVRGIWPGGSPGPHPKGGLRGIWPGSLQAHTWGVSRPTPGGSITACTEAKNCIKMKKNTDRERARPWRSLRSTNNQVF